MKWPTTPGSLIPVDASFNAKGCLTLRATDGFTTLFRQWLWGAWIDDVGSPVWWSQPARGLNEYTPVPRARRLCRLHFTESPTGSSSNSLRHRQLSRSS